MLIAQIGDYHHRDSTGSRLAGSVGVADAFDLVHVGETLQYQPLVVPGGDRAALVAQSFAHSPVVFGGRFGYATGERGIRLSDRLDRGFALDQLLDRPRCQRLGQMVGIVSVVHEARSYGLGVDVDHIAYAVGVFADGGAQPYPLAGHDVVFGVGALGYGELDDARAQQATGRVGENLFAREIDPVVAIEVTPRDSRRRRHFGIGAALGDLKEKRQIARRYQLVETDEQRAHEVLGLRVPAVGALGDLERRQNRGSRLVESAVTEWIEVIERIDLVFRLASGRQRDLFDRDIAESQLFDHRCVRRIGEGGRAGSLDGRCLVAGRSGGCDSDCLPQGGPGIFRGENGVAKVLFQAESHEALWEIETVGIERFQGGEAGRGAGWQRARAALLGQNDQGMWILMTGALVGKEFGFAGERAPAAIVKPLQGTFEIGVAVDFVIAVVFVVIGQNRSARPAISWSAIDHSDSFAWPPSCRPKGTSP